MSEAEVLTQTPSERVEELETRVKNLEETLIATNDALVNIQKSIVDLTANHMQEIFSNDVMIDSIAQRMLIAGANAIAFKAKSSKQRAPELVVVEGYIPGAIRVTLHDNGVLVEEQTDTGEWVTGDAMSEELRQEEVLTVFGNLVISSGGELNRQYYVVENTHLEEFRAQTSAKAMEITRSIQEDTPVDPDAAEWLGHSETAVEGDHRTSDRPL